MNGFVIRRGVLLASGVVLLSLASPGLAQEVPIPGASPQAVSPDPEMPRPIDAFDTVFLEEMTWLEVRDAMRAGKTTVIIPTGGIEQNGPYLALGKHNYILRATSDAIARKLGNALVAPIVAFVPEGDIDPPSGHMRYPGTISLRPATFKLLVLEIAECLRAHGFEHVILIGDSGGNQDPLAEVAAQLSGEWAGGRTSIHYVREYYDNPRWRRWLRDRGIHEVDEGFHDDMRHTSIMMTVDPITVRMEQRLAKGKFSINGVNLEPAEQTITVGRELVDYQASVTVEAIKKAIGR